MPSRPSSIHESIASISQSELSVITAIHQSPNNSTYCVSDIPPVPTVPPPSLPTRHSASLVPTTNNPLAPPTHESLTPPPTFESLQPSTMTVFPPLTFKSLPSLNRNPHPPSQYRTPSLHIWQTRHPSHKQESPRNSGRTRAVAHHP